jgi:hypothetical protein
MQSAWLVRARWRRRGAWLWPVFVALTVLDGIIAHLLPPTGETESFGSALLVAFAVNLLAVLLLCAPLGALLRRRRPDLPMVVARDYAGRVAISALTLALVTIGLIHHATIVQHEQAMRDATVRAQAWIGDHAPREFRRSLDNLSTVAIQPGSMYRTCVHSDFSAHTYCVVVDTRQPFAQSVHFSGYEPNALMFEGTN